MKGARPSPRKHPPDAQCHRGPVLASVAVVVVGVVIAARTIHSDWDGVFSSLGIAWNWPGQGRSPLGRPSDTATVTQREMTATSSTDGSDDVPVWDWAPDRSVARQVVQFGRPVVIRNSVVTRWAAMKSWTVSYLTKKLKRDSEGALARHAVDYVFTSFCHASCYFCPVQVRECCCCFCDLAPTCVGISQAS